MFGNGMEKEIIITVLEKEFTQSGMFGVFTEEYKYERLGIWANKGYEENFRKVKGIINVEVDRTGFQYIVSIDPRYNLKWVISEIEATVKTQKPIIKRNKKQLVDYDNNEDET